MTTIETNKKFKCPFTKAVINLEKKPYIPEGWTLSYSKKNERKKIKLCFIEFELFSTEQQKVGVSVDEEKFYTELPKDGACPANFLDHFLKC